MSMTTGVEAGRRYRPITFGTEMHSGGEKPRRDGGLGNCCDGELRRENKTRLTKRGVQANDFHA
jgi:hypothetical protein